MNKENNAPMQGNINGIDRQSYEPAYIQLVNILKQHVSSGIMRPGDRLPSESQLCRQYQVSPMTVRRAINILSDQGIVDTVQGRGTFVKPIKLIAATFHLNELQGIFDDRQTNVKILEVRIVSSDRRTAEKLGIAVRDRVIYIRRLLTRKKKPLLYHRDFLINDPLRPVVEAELEVTSLKGLIEGEGGSDFKRGDLSFEATIINEEEAKILQTQIGSAAFCLEHIFYDFEDKPVSWGYFICPGDQLRFTTTVGFRPEGVQD